MNNRSKQSSHSNDEWAENIWRFAIFSGSVCKEILSGIFEFRLPLFATVFATAFLRVALLRKWDFELFGKGSNWELIWTKPQLWILYYYIVVSSPALAWGITRVFRKRNYRSEMDTMFQASGVTNRIGQTPKPVQSFQTHDGTKVLRVAAKGISVDDFKKTKPALEQSLRAHIDGFEANLAKGTIDIKYSGEPMPEEFEIGERDLSVLRSAEFIIGKKKSMLMRTQLGSVPHLLIAGETGSGKSTFLRQFITGLYLNNPDTAFLLVDLKGGLEFSPFRGLPRLNIMADLDSAITGILTFESEMDRRFRLIEGTQCRDIEAYNEMHRGKPLNRHLVVIDEVAELFLTGLSRSDGGLEKSKGILNRVARQGRAIGIHLVVATQRPDTRSLDSQIKANLTGVLCFPMVNDASSINVIGNGKATELPHIKGRAIWKVGCEMAEVQTPYLSEQEALRLLSPHRRSANTLARAQYPGEADRFRPLN
jgi:DNA segregation ATPase FtsK/SpoIIIE, S-DNA-T family